MERGHGPQALLIHGAAGTGRRFLGLWYASALLGVPGGRFAKLAEDDLDTAEAAAELAHPDLVLVTPPPEKTSIPVASIRSVIEFLHLKILHPAFERHSDFVQVFGESPSEIWKLEEF